MIPHKAWHTRISGLAKNLFLKNLKIPIINRGKINGRRTFRFAIRLSLTGTSGQVHKLNLFILRGFGYEMIPEGNGWLVKESLRSWQFLYSINEMEEYVKEVQARHQRD